jgi:putative transposase
LKRWGQVFKLDINPEIRYFNFMARPLRIEYEGALYHITARGNEYKSIYREDNDYHKFLDILSLLFKRFQVIIHGYVLMGNHYHLLMETPKANITKAIHYLNGVYTGYFNRKYNRIGHLFQGRYKSILIEKEGYLLSVSRYIHLNPVRAGITKKAEEYKWSSYAEFIGKVREKEWLYCEWILDRFSENNLSARRVYKEYVEQGLVLKENPFQQMKSSLIVGSEKYFEEIIKKIKLERNNEIPETKALIKCVLYEDVIDLVARRFGIAEEQLFVSGKRNNLARNICLYLLREKTDMSNNEIAKSFGIGYTAVSQAAARIRAKMISDPDLRKIVHGIEGGLSEK